MLEDLFVGADSPIKGQADTFAQLPATAELGDLFVVKTTTGVIGVNRKVKGLYRWDGAAWVFADGIEANKVIYNNADSSLTSGTVKAAIDELDTKLDGLTGGDVNVNADWSETDSNSDAFILNKPTTITSSERAKLGHISVTQAVDLDTMESNIAANNAKVTNATHTGDVTGSTALTIANDSVTNAKMANVATGTVKGRNSAGVGDVEDLNIDTTLKAALNLSKSDVGLSNVPNTNCTNASNISSGTLNTNRLPPSATFGDGISTGGSDVYTDNGAFIAKDLSGDFADRTGSNIDHIWHDDTNNAWNFCSDTTYKGEGNSELKAQGLHIKSAGDARIIIEADTDNVSESDNAYLKMTQDGGSVGSIFGLCPGANKDPENQTYTGALSNSLLINNFYSGASITFGTNNSGTSAVRLRIAANGDLTASAKLICEGVARVNGAASYNNVALNSRAIGSDTDDFIYYGEDSSGSGRFSVRSSDGTVWSSSDKRWKKNIESLSGILNKVCQCVLSKFHFKKQEDTELKSIGFISQEIEPIFPELVEDLPDGYKAINYDRFGAIAFQAIKELREEKDAQIKKLEARIETLEAKL